MIRATGKIEETYKCNDCNVNFRVANEEVAIVCPSCDSANVVKVKL